MTACLFEGCESPAAPNDGEFCIAHSKKLATPYSANRARIEAQGKKSSKVAAKGINTSVDFANFMGALISDIVDGKIDPETANAAVKAGDAMLKVVELRLRYGFKKEALQLADQANGIADPPEVSLGTKTKQ